MSMAGALATATSGLLNVNRQLAVLSQNVANAGTPGYVTEDANQVSLSAGGVGMGVISKPATIQVDAQLQAETLAQNATVAGLHTTASALSGIDSALGSTAGNNDLASLLGNLQSAFSSLLNDPSNQPQQDQVVASAQTLANSINRLAQAYGAARQTAQDTLVTEVASLNGGLAQIGQLTSQIVALQNAGLSSADLQNQRIAAMQTVSSLMDIKFIPEAGGHLLAVTGGGSTIPLDAASGPFSIAPATLGPSATYANGGAPALLLNGTDITRQPNGGAIGANLALRDATLPTEQAELDEFSQNLASRFSVQGLTLFTDPTGAVPAGGGMPVQSGYVGFANIIQVNPAVSANPSLVRDGTADVTGSPTGASSFTTNPASGPAGFATLITRVLDYTFGADVQDGVTQPATQTTALGQDGTLVAPYDAPATLADQAATLVAVQSQQSGLASSELTTEQGVQTALQTQVTNQSSVSVDAQLSNMVQLQNAYAANAKIMAAIQQMWTDLITSVTTTG
jgi:flagellar hook-associated protein 1 FlgK